MQYHWVVAYDFESDSFEIDWDLTYHGLDGVVYDNENNEWYALPEQISNQTEIFYEHISTNLAKALDKLDRK